MHFRPLLLLLLSLNLYYPAVSGQCPPEGGPALEQSGNMFYHLGEESGTNYANSGAGYCSNLGLELADSVPLERFEELRDFVVSKGESVFVGIINVLPDGSTFSTCNSKADCDQKFRDHKGNRIDSANYPGFWSGVGNTYCLRMTPQGDVETVPLSENPGCDQHKIVCQSDCLYKVDGDWTEWGPLVDKCGGNICPLGITETSKYRSCTNPSPSADPPGQKCLTQDNQGNDVWTNGETSYLCNGNKPCPIWTAWSQWSACPVTCGAGPGTIETRTRVCEEASGQPAPDPADCDGVGEDEEERECGQSACPVWGEWGQWSSCDATCGSDGLQSRSRDCKDESTLETLPIEDCDATQEGGAEEGPCTDVPPTCPFWMDWSPWSVCSSTCGPGESLRSRVCLDSDANQAAESLCLEDGQEGGAGATACDEGECPAWSPWSPSGPCSLTCGGGTVLTQRSCQTSTGTTYGPESCGGGEETGEDVCNEQDCPQPAWADWAPWNTCSVTCDGGTQTRSRDCVHPDEGLTANDECEAVAGEDTSEEEQECNTEGCPMPDWAPWGEWNTCPVTCGGGNQSRSRDCMHPDTGITVPRDCEEDPAVDTTQEEQACNEEACPMPAWASWSEWATCPVTCEGSTQTRNRDCVHPDEGLTTSTECEEDETVDTSQEEQVCNEHQCPVPVGGNWASWGVWSVCQGLLQVSARMRTCSDPAPAHGGADCVGGDREEQDCPATWADWGLWSSCSSTCGTPVQTRIRRCNFDGLCPGEDAEAALCLGEFGPCPGGVAFASKGVAAEDRDRYLADFVFSHFDMGPGAANPNPTVCASLCRRRQGGGGGNCNSFMLEGTICHLGNLDPNWFISELGESADGGGVALVYSGAF